MALRIAGSIVLAALVSIGWRGLDGSHDPGGGIVLRLAIELNDSLFEPGERISVCANLENVSDSPVAINGRFSFPGPEVHLRIMNEDGNEITWLPAEPPRKLEMKDLLELDPEAIVRFRVDKVESWLSSPLRPGDYTVYAIYRNKSREAFGKSLWVGEVVSNTVRFTVGDGSL